MSNNPTLVINAADEEEGCSMGAANGHKTPGVGPPQQRRQSMSEGASPDNQVRIGTHHDPCIKALQDCDVRPSTADTPSDGTV